MELVFKASSNLLASIGFSIHPIRELNETVKSILIVCRHPWMTSRKARSARENARYLSDRSESPAFFKEVICDFLGRFPLPIGECNCDSMSQSEVSPIYTHNCNRESGGYSDLCDQDHNKITH